MARPPPFIFGATRVRHTPHDSHTIAKIAAKHGCRFRWSDPIGGSGYRCWFETIGPSLGEPFDSFTRRGVLEAIDRAGVYYGQRPGAVRGQ